MGMIEEIATRLCVMRAAALPEDERALQARHFDDAVIAALSGRDCRETRALRPLLGDAVDSRMGYLAAAIRMTEVDDIHLPSCTTPSSVVVPVALIMAGDSDEQAAHFSDALLAGMSALIAFGTAIEGPKVLYREVWPTYFAAPFAAAATGARMLRLDARRTAHALAMSLNLIAGASGRFRTGLSPRWLLHASGVTAGALAARAAAAGFEGDLALLDRDWLTETHGVAFSAELMLTGLDVKPYGQLSMKPYPSAKQAIPAIEALRALVAEGLRPEEIRKVRVKVPRAYQRMIDSQADPTNRSTTFSSLRYQMALALFAPRSLYDIARERMPMTPEMIAFMAKVTVAADSALDSHYPRRWPAEVMVETGKGQVTRRLIAAPGDPESAFGEAALADKAQRMLSPTLAKGEIDAWMRTAREALSPERSVNALKILSMIAAPQLTRPTMDQMEKVF